MPVGRAGDVDFRVRACSRRLHVGMGMAYGTARHDGEAQNIAFYKVLGVQICRYIFILRHAVDLISHGANV